MIKVSDQQTQKMNAINWERWVSDHLHGLADLTPEVAGLYAPIEWRDLVDRALRRANVLGLSRMRETMPYCYGVVELGLNFETGPDAGAVKAALALPGGERTDALWETIGHLVDTGVAP